MFVSQRIIDILREAEAHKKQRLREAEQRAVANTASPNQLKKLDR